VGAFINGWNHVVGSYNSLDNSVNLYLNGKLVKSQIITTSAGQTSNLLYIGRPTQGGWNFFTGDIALTKIYDRALTELEVAQNYNATSGRFGTPMVMDASLKLLLDAGSPTSYPGSGSTWTDLSGNSNNVTLYNSPTYSTLNGGMLTFNGSYGLTTSTSVLSSTAYTKMAWFRFAGLGGPNNIISGNGEDHAFWGGNSTKLRAGHQNTGFVALQSITDLVPNVWFFGAVSFNTTTGWKLYLNGKLEATSSNTTTFTGVGNIEIGGFAGAGNYLNGDIAIAGVYNRVLTDAEIQQNFNADRARFGI